MEMDRMLLTKGVRMSTSNSRKTTYFSGSSKNAFLEM